MQCKTTILFELQPILETEIVRIIPLKKEDFDELYKVAADPLMWLQHPNKNRYKKSEFTVFFEGAIQSGGAFKIIDKKTKDIIGSTRFYDFDAEKKTVSIGYTFLAITHWGKGYNPAVKKMMIEHAFQYADKILFHIGAKNKRSQTAISRVGAIKIDEQEMKYHGEDEHLGFIYELTPKRWMDFLKEQEEKKKNESGD